MVAVAILSAVYAPSAQAFPPFATAEGISCKYCHINPAGGGKRNYRGLYYKLHDKSFAGFDDKAEAAKAGEPIGADAEMKPKSLTPPAGGTDAKPTPAPAPAATPSPAVAAAKKKLAVAEAAYTKKPKDAATKKAYASALATLGHAVMLDQSMPPVKRYPSALTLARKSLKIDPTNKTAAADKKAIEGAYKSMGKPIPAG